MFLNARLTAVLNSLKISRKIQLIFIPPMAVLSLFVIAVIFSNIQTIQSAKQTVRVVELSHVLDGVAHNFAVERGLTAGYLGSKGAVGPEALAKQRIKADAARAQFTSVLESGISDLPEAAQASMQAIQKHLAGVASLRQSVDGLSASGNPFGFYSSLNKMALDTMSILAASIESPTATKQLNLLNSLLWLKERSGQERGALNGVFASDTFTIAKALNVNVFIADQTAKMELVSRYSSPEQYSRLQELMSDEHAEAVIHYRNIFYDALNTSASMGVDSKKWFAASTNRIKNIKRYADGISEDIIRDATGLLRKAWLALLGTLVIAVVGAAALIVFSNTIIRLLTGSIESLTNSLNSVREEKDFSVRVQASSRDELGTASAAFNALMDQLQQAISSVNAVMAAVAKGDFSARIHETYEGDLDTLKASVNNSAGKVDVTMQALGDVMAALEQGDFSARMSNQVEGEFKLKVDRAMATMDKAVAGVGEVMSAMSNGDFSQRINLNLAGSLNTLKKSVNTSVSNIESAFSDISSALDEQAKGNFSWRISAAYKGDLLALTNTVNTSMESLDGAMQEIASVFQCVKAGDFSTRIQQSLSGDLENMKVNINGSLERLDAAIAEIVGVANAQQKGCLDARIEGDYEGQLAELKCSLNQSGTALSSTISRVNKVMQSMQEGDFSERVEGDLQGSFETLQAAINASVSSLQNAVADITSIANAQQQGELNKRMSQEHRGELLRISEAVNDSMQNIGNTIQDVQMASKHALTMSGEQAKASGEMSRRTESQAAALEEIASTMEQISSTVTNTESDCLRMAKHIGEAKDVTQSSRSTVESTVNAMAHMRSSSDEIAKITGMIDEIAFQTNLLALNAAVEAARAGEQGRGFAVVAGEVRNLAQRSSDAAKDIKSLIDENLRNVEDSYKLAQQSTIDLQDIAQIVETANELTQNVTEAAQEQSRGVQEINSAINSLDSMTQENAAMVEQTTAAAKSVEDQFVEVNQKMAFFKLG